MVQPTAFVESLTDEQLDEVWFAAQPYMGISDEDSLAQALSGSDISAARSYLWWIHRQVRDGRILDELSRDFLLAALDRFSDEKGLTLGQAFGLERKKRGNPPSRLGVVGAINGLIQYLHDQCGYSLGESTDRSSAFEVAAVLLKRRWRFDRSAYTLRDQYWAKRHKGESS